MSLFVDFPEVFISNLIIPGQLRVFVDKTALQSGDEKLLQKVDNVILLMVGRRYCCE